MEEISFGAFDSELMHQEISIPEGFKATIDGNKIILTRIENEDERVRKALITFFQGFPYSAIEKAGTNLKEAIAWLEKQGEQKSSWSKEDENTIKVLMNIIRKSEIINSIIYTDSLKEKLYDWLKSIRPQNHWKPSDEQMRALDSTAGIVGILTPTGVTLCSLYKDLEKLK